MRIGSMVDLPAPREPRFASFRFPCAAIRHSTQRLDEECYIIGKLLRRCSVLNSTCPAVLSHRAAITVEKPLEDGQSDDWRIAQVLHRNEFVIRLRAGEPKLTHCLGYRVLDPKVPAPADSSDQNVVDV